MVRKVTLRFLLFFTFMALLVSAGFAQEGTVRGITREYQNFRFNWIATQANRELNSMEKRIGQLKMEWKKCQWANGELEQKWALMSLDTADIQNTWNFLTQQTQKTILKKETMLLLLEGMTKLHKQLGKSMPPLTLIAQQCTETAVHYSKKKISVDTPHRRLPIGDMASVDRRLYSIIINVLKINVELFGGAINHHPEIPTWYTARREDTFWGGLFDCMREPTWANLRAIVNPPYEMEMVKTVMQKITQSVKNSISSSSDILITSPAYWIFD